MSEITIAGGLYRECCIWPEWDQVYGSAGRAAVAAVGHVSKVNLHCYVHSSFAARFNSTADLFALNLVQVSTPYAITFEYNHCLSVPAIRPSLNRINQNSPFKVDADLVLRFGMLEGSAIVNADRCVYDPQSAFDPQPFHNNGSQAKRLAIVANRSEICALGKNDDPIKSAQALVQGSSAEVVVVKSGVHGAYVVQKDGTQRVPPYESRNVWTIGSGDVFASMFAVHWGALGDSALDAAMTASRAVATYAESMSLPSPAANKLAAEARKPVKAIKHRVYLASPFFTMGQRWLVDESLQFLRELEQDVFSPIHDVGPGPAHEVAPADLKALDECDVVFAILDGCDSGTLFEVGYARAHGKPVFALAQTVTQEDLKMVTGSGCLVFHDFVTALHHLAWHP